MQYSNQQIVDITMRAAEAKGIPGTLLLALFIAESGLRPDAERWAYRNASNKHVNLTERAQVALALGDHSMLAGVIQEINDHGSNDISFGLGQQTVRWAKEGTQQQDIANILMIRDLYLNPEHAANVAAANVAYYWFTYRDVLEALCRYNKPALSGSQNPNRANYQRGIRRATELLGVVLPEPPGQANYLPEIFQDPGFVAGSFADRVPRGVILHGSRSGSPTNDTRAEFNGTRSWARSNPQGLGWHATIGDDVISLHYGPQQWGWNAAGASDDYLGVEFAQPTVNKPISDGQVRAFVWWMKTKVLPTHPAMSLHFPTHAEVEASGETGKWFGKSDVFPAGDNRALELRGRIIQMLLENPSPTEAEMQELQQLRDKVAQQQLQLDAQKHHFAIFLPSEIDRRLADPNDLPENICRDVASELRRHA
jgi:hypothetical protein